MTAESAQETRLEPAGEKPARTLSCDTCHGPFAATGGWKQRFCSTKCRNDWHRRLTPEALRRELDAAIEDAKAMRSAQEALNLRVAELERRVSALDDPTAREVAPG